MRTLLILMLVMPTLLGAQFRKGYKMLGKQRLPEATAAFAKDTAHAKAHKKALALYGLSRVQADKNAKNRDLQLAYLKVDQASLIYPDLKKGRKKKAAKYGLDEAALNRDRNNIAMARLNEMAASPNGDDLEVFLAWPRLPEGPVRGVWPLVERLTFEGRNQGLFEAHIRANAPEKNAERVLIGVFKHFATTQAWDSVAAIARRFEPAFPNKSEWLNNVAAIASAPDQQVTVKNLGATVNTEKEEYLPVLTADDGQLYFCGRMRQDNLGYEDVYVSNWKNGQWEKASLVPDLSRRESNDAPLSVTADGNKLLFFREGRLYFCNKTASGWGEPEDVKVINNNFKWVGDAQVAANGQALLFTASTSPFDPYTRCGLYVSLLDTSGNWQPPFAIDVLNTDSTDRSPYLHPDMQTMYFSSSGRNGLNSMDVYVTTRLDDTWKSWSTPKNLGKEFNSFDADWGYTISTDGTKAYFSTNHTAGHYDLFVADLPESLRPRPVTTLKGQILDPKKNVLEGEILLVDLDNNKPVGKLRTDPVTKFYFATVPNGGRYKLYSEVEGYISQEYTIDLKTERVARNLKQDIEARPRTPQVPEPRIVYFDHDRSLAQKTADPDLKYIAQTLQENDFLLDIAGHTDNVGPANYNQLLSENRAKFVLKELVKLGCPKDRMTAKGLGETKPAFDNKTKEGRAKNRRVELIFKPKQ
jgi:outer membrane protein OmpA-like peptidoglycan-associated protein